jgi:hypothetical protein
VTGLIYTTCGPFICAYPKAADTPRGTHWTCPTCQTKYRMTRRIREMPWRNWSAPYGHWVLAHPIRWHLHAARTGRAV